jgi:L-amino acid N-acyltransferase YncA
MVDKVIIRDAAESDLESILGIYNDVILNSTAVFSEQPHTMQMRTDWFHDRINNNFPVFVAAIKDRVVGFSSFGHFRAWPCYRFTVEVSVYVDAAYRGQGISKLLLKSLIDNASKRKMHAVIASITAGNEVSINLHQSFNFIEVAHFKEVGFKFGKWLDVKFFELLL